MTSVDADLRSGRRLETGRLSYILQRTSKIEQKTQEGKFIIESKLVRETNKKERTQLFWCLFLMMSFIIKHDVQVPLM
jgi:hypothetical protein